jgi:hypothetical protein
MAVPFGEPVSVAARLAGGSDLEGATAGKPDGYREPETCRSPYFL